MNGVRRAISSPRRLIGLVIGIAYYLQFAVRSMIVAPSVASGLPTVESLPSDQAVGAILFGLFGLLSLMLMITAFQPRGGFRAADVDVLFPTPVSPKVVLVFRLIRDYLLTMLLPLAFTVMGPMARFGYQFLFHSLSAQSRWITVVLPTAWILLALMWVSLGYGLSMYINRSDLRSDRNKRLFEMLGYGALVVTALNAAAYLHAGFSVQAFLGLAYSPTLRILLFGGSFASWASMGAFSGNPTQVALGLAGLVAGILLGLWMAFSQVGFLYDQAAARGFGAVTMRKLQRSGDMYGLVAENARAGRIRKNRIARRVSALRVRGGAALVWKEVLLHARSSAMQYYMLGPIAIMMAVLPVYVMRNNPEPGEFWIILAMGFTGAFLITMNNATSGYIELLRRVDFQKPLPFSPWVTAIWEIVGKTFPTILISAFSMLLCVVVDPSVWEGALVGLVLLPSVALLLSSVILVVSLLLPDIEDTAQRGLRGMLSLIGVVIACGPGALLLLLLVSVFHLDLVVAGFPSVMVNLGLAGTLAYFSGLLYADYNASE